MERTTETLRSVHIAARAHNILRQNCPKKYRYGEFIDMLIYDYFGYQNQNQKNHNHKNKRANELVQTLDLSGKFIDHQQREEGQGLQQQRLVTPTSFVKMRQERR
jgi:hypothetical protein